MMFQKSTGAGRAFGAVCAGLALTSTLAAPVSAAAATKTTDGMNGVQSQQEDVGIDYQSFITTIDDNGDVTGEWGDSNTEDETAADYYKGEEDGKVRLFYNTTDGIWYDEGRDPDVPGEDGNGNPENQGDDTDKPHANGTYIVTIPTKIAYDGMSVGTVSTSDDYNVNVVGVIQDGQTVTLTAETGNHLKNGDREDITETTKQGKNVWNADETYGYMNSDGSLHGTDTTDNISLKGTVKVAGVYEGSVTYTAELS